MSQVEIHDTGAGANRMRVTSHGNGFAYSVSFGEAGSPMRDIFVQGDDAIELRHAYDAAETVGLSCRDAWLAAVDPHL